MTCNGVSFGTEARQPDWTSAELELLDKELETARARVRLEEAKRQYISVESLVLYESRTDRAWVVSHLARLKDAEEQVYQQAHDRHFLRLIREKAERVPARHHPHH